MLPWVSAAATARRCQRVAAATAHVDTHHAPRVVSITTPPRATGIPQYRRLHHVTSGHTLCMRPPTDVWPLHVPLVCVACTPCRCHGWRSACARPLRCHGAAQRLRTAPTAPHAPVGGADVPAYRPGAPSLRRMVFRRYSRLAALRGAGARPRTNPLMVLAWCLCRCHG